MSSRKIWHSDTVTIDSRGSFHSKIFFCLFVFYGIYRILFGLFPLIFSKNATTIVICNQSGSNDNSNDNTFIIETEIFPRKVHKNANFGVICDTIRIWITLFVSVSFWHFSIGFFFQNFTLNNWHIQRRTSKPSILWAPERFDTVTQLQLTQGGQSQLTVNEAWIKYCQLKRDKLITSRSKVFRSSFDTVT